MAICNLGFVPYFSFDLNFIFKMSKLVIAAGTGFLGEVLIKYFKCKYDEIIILSRQKKPNQDNVSYVVWNGYSFGDWCEALKQCDVLINLTGKSVNCRYTEKNKKEILDSRLNANRVLGEALESIQHQPEVWINAASATIYEASFDRPNTEANGIIGDDFSMNVCKAWEQSFFEMKNAAKRMIAMRIAIVLGSNGGAYTELERITKMGLGGKSGSGKQMVSWVHVTDFARMVEWLIQNSDAEGIYNCSAPHPITNAELMTQLRKKLKVGIGIPSPAWLLEIGTFFLSTESELVLKSRFVLPERAIQEGFDFKFKTIDQALTNI
jgi:uncharacterized protein